MNEQERWLAANDQYLATTLEWLRERLNHMAAANSRDGAAGRDIPTPAPARPRSLRDRIFRSDVNSTGAPPLPPPQGGADAAASARGAIPLAAPQVETVTAERPPALVQLADRLGLSEFERHTLVLCAAMELDTRMGSLCANAQATVSRAYPTFALALALFDQPSWDVLSPERPLRYWRLIEINQPGAQPLINSALKADERIVNYIKGLNYLDDRLAPLVAPVIHHDAPLPPSQARAADDLVAWLRAREHGSRMPLIQLLGSDSQSKLTIVGHALASLDLTLYRIALDALPTQTADQETFVRLWQRESALLPIALYVDASQAERSGNLHAPAAQRLFARSTGVMFLDTREPWQELGRDSISLDIAKPTPAEQHAAWAAVLGGAGGELPARLAGQFNLDIARIRAIAADALARLPEDQTGAATVVWDLCASHARPALDQLAQRLEPKSKWDDLELPAAEKALLRQIVKQVKGRTVVYDDWGFRERMNRGLGISALFAGESGTGKTMAAEVMADELRLPLYRIDLSAVVSKFIGEMEKNLRKLFDAAEDGGAILFFDEADALFGKRSEVKDSHDRYANIEINYLLQRMEAYGGLAILATNMRSAMDDAFVRRLRFIVNFPFPGIAERKAIWEHVFPPDTPLADIDFQRLARLNLTGGSIHNIALNAAFLAAQADPQEVTMPIILEAARNEFRKLEKPINDADFRWLEAVEAKA
jgi:hypothetical protein